jgi:D-alanyl-D-alanine dipeptidase
VVTTTTWQESSAILYLFERSEEMATKRWRFHSSTAAVIGRSGFGVGPETFGLNGPLKQEGDGRAPAGIFSVPFAFGSSEVRFNDNISFPFRTMTEQDRCIDDSASAHYNSIVNSSNVALNDWKSSEKMIHPDGLYDLGIFINYNKPIPSLKRGSCIFLHVWRDANLATDGCTAISKQTLHNLLTWLKSEQHPLLVQAPREEYEKLASIYQLPPLPVSEKKLSYVVSEFKDLYSRLCTLP